MAQQKQQKQQKQQRQQRQQRQQTPVRVAPVRGLKAPTVITPPTLSKLDYEISLLWGAIRFTCHKAPVLTSQQTGEEQ